MNPLLSVIVYIAVLEFLSDRIGFLRTTALATTTATTTSNIASSASLVPSPLQMLVYIKRNPSFTRKEFWMYWQEQHAPKVAPLAEHVGVMRYQQVQASGFILPNPPTDPSGDNPTPVEFDGIAMFLVPSEDTLTALTSHPYYKEVVRPDEEVFIDSAAPNGGQVATFTGPHASVVESSLNVHVGDEAVWRKWKGVFEGYGGAPS